MYRCSAAVEDFGAAGCPVAQMQIDPVRHLCRHHRVEAIVMLCLYPIDDVQDAGVHMMCLTIGVETCRAISQGRPDNVRHAVLGGHHGVGPLHLMRANGRLW